VTTNHLTKKKSHKIVFVVICFMNISVLDYGTVRSHKFYFSVISSARFHIPCYRMSCNSVM